MWNLLPNPSENIIVVLHPMKVAGFTFVRNALKYDYPVVQAIRSILPICDYFVVAVGKSEDATLELVRSIGDPKIHIIETEWDDSMREGGRVLALETDKAFQAIPQEYDWCFYIQGDECVHENALYSLRASMEHWLEDPQTEGLLFDYRHFYGSYDFVGMSRRWYRREIRIVRNDKKIFSYRDAQGFRKGDGAKLQVRRVHEYIHHYGWVRHPEVQQQKQLHFKKLYLTDEAALNHVGTYETFPYDGLEPLERFEGTHPAVMLPRIEAQNWLFQSDPSKAQWPLKDRISNWIEKWTGWRPGEYRNYVLLK
ncbi:MAG: glycosyltransferase family 2 protein [Saprospiraceae bacterium]|nr:glycosyltransferase family 2 protein [Saprospiraceae bacterium]